jgi:quinol monooxygenase YgiN
MPYIRVTRSKLDPSQAEAGGALARQIATIVQGMPGCQAVHAGVDRAAGQGIFISIWDSEEHAQLDRAALGDVMGQLQELGVELEAAAIYEAVES